MTVVAESSVPASRAAQRNVDLPSRASPTSAGVAGLLTVAGLAGWKSRPSTSYERDIPRGCAPPVSCRIIWRPSLALARHRATAMACAG